ncbi:MAG TPA: glycosyltransferase family 39 protein [Candidatus Angelobacter sp.]|nr:glycosyltransferase family 39 protein [Candidatus Angelobacter sp.]
MRDLLGLLRRNWLFFTLATAAALALRFFFVFQLPHISGDTFIYGNIAKNWLTHGIYGLTDGNVVRPTLIRLPGYPAFLAAMFAVFGHEHYTAVMIVQALIDTNTCLVIAALALELMNTRAAKIAYLLAALCPFTANYVATPLAETLSIFCTAHALYYGVRGIKALKSGEAGPLLWCLSGFWTALAILLRPDGGLLIPALGLAILLLLVFRPYRKQAVVAGLLFVMVSLAPLVPWTIRNWRTFHVFQPLAPRFANDPGEFVPHGFNRWVKTWLADFASVDDVFWKVNGEPINFHVLPERAFDSRREYDRTRELINQYNRKLQIDPALDQQFGSLAQERIFHNPFRYLAWMPFLRITDMWLRPRTEMLPVDTYWWRFSEHEEESFFALLWAALNLFYLVAALRGWVEWRLGICAVPLIAYMLMRSVLLGVMPNPEPRYVLECFPIVLALAAGAFVLPSLKRDHSRSTESQEVAPASLK